ncbi:MAG: hypothetical protein C4B58_15850 [Deltaproteobacteria bacterium]|nr:MAG: hypothetical protein C4B58_15850 [Deltaproteobacteria bacterium]
MTRSHKIAIAITSLVAIGVSTYIVLYNFFPFDGAFSSQAAINLYKHGTFTLNYRPNSTLQTLLPFQIVNGFFFTIFGNTFSAANLANILFYFFLFGLFIFLSCACKSVLPLIAFTAMSLNYAFFMYGFGGYGEIPALTYGLLGVACLVFNQGSTRAYVLAGILVAAAIATKWVLFLILPPVCLTLVLLKPNRRLLLYFLAALLFTFMLACYIQFACYEPCELKQIIQNLIYQNTPHFGGPYHPQKAASINAYPSRLKEVWDAYSDMSIGVFALVKIGLTVIMAFVAIRMLFRRKAHLETTEVFFIFLASFLVVYLAWAFAFNSRWHIRRMLNTDILFYLSIGLLPCVVRFRKIINLAVCCLLFLFCGFLGPFLLQDLVPSSQGCVMTRERQMRQGLKLLPDEYNAYGNGFLEAPRWSFLAGRNFKDLFRDSVFYDCIEQGCDNFIFFEGEICFHPAQRDLVYNTFDLNRIFNFHGFRICRIQGFNNDGKVYVEAIDFSRAGAAQSVTRIHGKTRNKMYRPSQFEYNEMAVFLDNKRGLPLLEVEFFADECHDGKNLRVAILNGQGKYVEDFKVKKGENTFEIALPEEFSRSEIDMYLLLEKELKNAAHHCTKENANRISLEYKMIRLVAESGELK